MKNSIIEIMKTNFLFIIIFFLLNTFSYSQSSRVLSNCNSGFPISSSELFLVSEEPPYFGTCSDFQLTKKNTYKCSDENILEYLKVQIPGNEILDQSNELIIEMIVEKSGCLTNIKISKTNNQALALKLQNAIYKMDLWTPGKQNDRVVRVKMQISLPFQYLGKS